MHFVTSHTINNATKAQAEAWLEDRYADYPPSILVKIGTMTRTGYRTGWEVPVTVVIPDEHIDIFVSLTEEIMGVV